MSLLNTSSKLKFLEITGRKDCLVKNSMNYQVLMGIFEHRIKSLGDLSNVARIRKKFSSSVSYLKKKGFLTHDSDLLTLTQKGSWIAISQKLSISYFELWLLSEMYVRQKICDARNFTSPFSVSSFEDLFDMVIPKQSISNTMALLHKKRFVYGIGPRLYSLCAENYVNLASYDSDLQALQRHVRTLSVDCTDMLLNDKKIYQRFTKHTA